MDTNAFEPKVVLRLDRVLWCVNIPLGLSNNDSDTTNNNFQEKSDWIEISKNLVIRTWNSLFSVCNTQQVETVTRTQQNKMFWKQTARKGRLAPQNWQWFRNQNAWIPAPHQQSTRIWHTMTTHFCLSWSKFLASADDPLHTKDVDVTNKWSCSEWRETTRNRPMYFIFGLKLLNTETWKQTLHIVEPHTSHPPVLQNWLFPPAATKLGGEAAECIVVLAATPTLSVSCFLCMTWCCFFIDVADVDLVAIRTGGFHARHKAGRQHLRRRHPQIAAGHHHEAVKEPCFPINIHVGVFRRKSSMEDADQASCKLPRQRSGHNCCHSGFSLSHLCRNWKENHPKECTALRGDINKHVNMDVCSLASSHKRLTAGTGAATTATSYHLSFRQEIGSLRRAPLSCNCLAPPY